MASRVRTKVEVRPENFADQISLFSFHAGVVAPAMLFWLEAASGRIQPETMIQLSELFHITLFRFDDANHRGIMELTVNREEDGKLDYQLIFDFSEQNDFAPELVRQQVEVSLKKYHDRAAVR